MSFSASEPSESSVIVAVSASTDVQTRNTVNYSISSSGKPLSEASEFQNEDGSAVQFDSPDDASSTESGASFMGTSLMGAVAGNLDDSWKRKIGVDDSTRKQARFDISSSTSSVLGSEEIELLNLFDRIEKKAKDIDSKRESDHRENVKEAETEINDLLGRVVEETKASRENEDKEIEELRRKEDEKLVASRKEEDEEREESRKEEDEETMRKFQAQVAGFYKDYPSKRMDLAPMTPANVDETGTSADDEMSVSFINTTPIPMVSDDLVAVTETTSATSKSTCVEQGLIEYYCLT